MRPIERLSSSIPVYVISISELAFLSKYYEALDKEVTRALPMDMLLHVCMGQHEYMDYETVLWEVLDSNLDHTYMDRILSDEHLLWKISNYFFMSLDELSSMLFNMTKGKQQEVYYQGRVNDFLFFIPRQ